MLQNRLAKLREERANGENGFTLIELLVVVVIIGILIAIAIPLYLNYKKGANDSASASDLRGAISALEACNSSSNTGTYPTSLTITNGSAPCTGQTINLSNGTTMNYVANSTGTAYALQAYNTSGNTSSSSYYCYASRNGGSVSKSTNTFATAANVATTFSC